MAQDTLLIKMGLNQDLASKFCQSHHSKCHLDQLLEFHVGERVLQKQIPEIDLKRMISNIHFMGVKTTC